MNSQPKSRVLIELRGARLGVVSHSCRQQPMVTRALRRSSVGIDDRLHHSARAEYRGWSKCQNVFRRTTLRFVGFRNDRAARLKLVDVMLENRLGNRDQSGDVAVGRAGSGLDVSEVRSCPGLWTETEKEQVNAAKRLKLCDVADQFAFEILRVGAHRGEALHFAKEL